MDFDVLNRFDDFDRFDNVDDIEVEDNAGNRLPKRYFRDAENPFEHFREEDFKRRYRFYKNTVRDIIFPLVEHRLRKPTQVGLPIDPMWQLLITLWFYATGNFQMTDGDLMKVSQATVSNIVKRVSVLLARHAREIIRFPDNLDQVRRNFYAVAGFPQVIGCVDGVHIPIQNPGGDHAEIYRNRKHVFSLNVQICCGPRCEIFDIVSRHPGSVHDSTVFANSSLRARLEHGALEGIVLGDGAYACKNYLLTPVNVAHTQAEERYNVAQRQTRNKVERTFGMWKRKFPCLKRVLRTKLATAPIIICATAVLHNIYIQWKHDIGRDENESDEEEDEDLQDEEREDNDVVHPRRDEILGLAFRQHFINQHF